MNSILTLLSYDTETDDFLLGYTIQKARQQGTRRAPIRNEKSYIAGEKFKRQVQS